jgi:flavin reductase (DIM6/NTAB) family NADH-FMN oxidoreductase RutF
MKTLALGKVYQLLEPGPVVLLTTAQNGVANVMNMSWHMMVDFDPPLIACIVSDRDHSFKALRATRECVIAVPSVELAEKIVSIGNCSGRDVDKFSMFHIRQGKAAHVSAPLVLDCFANIECRVVDTRFVRRYGLFILEGVKAWIDPAQIEPRMIHHRGSGAFVVDGETIQLSSRTP